MKHLIIALSMLLLPGATAAYAYDFGSAKGENQVRLTKSDKVTFKKDYKKISRAIKLTNRAQKMSNEKKKRKALKKVVPILEKVKAKTKCSNIAKLADQEILKIESLENRVKLYGNVSHDESDSAAHQDLQFWGNFF